jgi:hypothetical protein
LAAYNLLRIRNLTWAAAWGAWFPVHRATRRRSDRYTAIIHSRGKRRSRSFAAVFP